MSGTTTLHKVASTNGATLCFFRCCANFWAPICLGLIASLSVVCTLDVADECNWSCAGPGLTFDENLNTASGVYVVNSLLDAGMASLHPSTLQEIFNSPNYYPDYPPLGRLPLGLCNAILGRCLGLLDHPFYLITYARVGSAMAFGVLIWLVTWFTRKHAGPLAGLVAGLSLLLTPRVFGHAHLASVESMMNLTYAACVIGTIETLAGKTTLRARDGLFPGCLLGLALLTKMQAIFLPPVIVLWLLWHWRLKGIIPLTVLATTSAVVFFVGWPWLWSDPIARFFAYFAQTTDRAVLYCYYFGQRYADRDVPWHYPFVMFLITTPLPWLLLGCWGMFRSVVGKGFRIQDSGFRTRTNQLLLGAFFCPLMAFAIPGVPVYDGDRLFLIIWPIFSIWVGIAASQLFDEINKRSESSERAPSASRCRSLLKSLVVVVMVFPLVSIITLHPCQLSYYNVLVGGLWGANQLGLERDYWGESLTPAFLEKISPELPTGSTVAIAPVLHPLFPRFLKDDSWLLQRPDITIVPYDDKQLNGPRYVLWIRREADSWKSLQDPPAGTRTLRKVTRQGVTLTELMELPE